MTDTTPEQTPETTDAPEATPDDATEGRPGREAAKYRRQLREVEAERDRLSTALTTYRRREAEELAEAAGMARGADLFDLGTDLGALLTEEGTVDPDKVKDAAAAILTERPHWGRPAPTLDLGIRGAPPATKGSTWEDVLRGA